MLLAKTISSDDLKNKSEIDISLFSLADWIGIARFMGYEPTWSYKMFCKFGDLKKYDLANTSRTTWSKIAQIFHQNQAWAEIQYIRWHSVNN
ncbi:MAG: hypothetical protein HC836_15015 [Richelia sp. RM2_1_2]|nr:hypothetical protein [Richelia sp. SM1_7_0]NJN09502.1 hypothetical protein [Richelia sp. RM1_1_1]NJO27221.1 hypothetical protein [Richelia sp. SL_2_1]NJO59558.1 hypothetical protein [Richelia sp. RM2_1_2]